MSGPNLRVLIVDDEALGRQRLEDLLHHEEGVEIVGFADNGDAAIEAIRTLKPELVFLDVQMPRRTGLEVVREMGPENMPATIFVTAYDRYALDAFDVAAVDYLVKPFDDERFEQAFQRARKMIGLTELGKLSEQLRTVLNASAAIPNTTPGAAGAACRAVARLRGHRVSGAHRGGNARPGPGGAGRRPSSTSPPAVRTRKSMSGIAPTSSANGCRRWRSGWIRRISFASTAR